MEAPDAAAPPRPPTLGWPVLLVWALLYLLMMAHGGWHWQRTGVLDFGMPAQATLASFGAPVPERVQDGEWHRLFLGPWLHRSLLGILLLAWFWSSTARGLVAMIGRPRTWLLFVLGGLAGGLAQSFFHPDSTAPGGAGPFDPIAAGIGAQLVWGFGSGSAHAARVRNGAIVSIVLIGVLTWFFTRESGRGTQVRALIGLEAMLAAFGCGAALMAGFGPRRSAHPAGAAVRFLSFVALALVLVSAVQQAPTAIASGQRGEAKRFLSNLQKVERAATDLKVQWAQSEARAAALARKRAALGPLIDELAGDSFLDGLDGEEKLRAYLTAMRAYTEPIRDTSASETRCWLAFQAWFDPHEKKLREVMGLDPRRASDRPWRP